MLTRLLFCLALLLPLSSAHAGPWQQTLSDARGQTVYFNAWGGSQEINTYIRWAGAEVKKRYGIRLVHVKVTDISDVVGRILAEKVAGKTRDGSVDMIWINGENFKAMKEAGLLHGPFVKELPNDTLVDRERLQVDRDFTVPVEGLEAPWGVGQLNLIFDPQRTPEPPTNAASLLAYAKAHPGRVAYPMPPEFHGSSFLKQVLLDLTDDPAPLYNPASEADVARVTAPLWRWLDALHPVAWRRAGAFPTGSSHMVQLLDDGEIDLAISFNPQDARAKAAQGLLPAGARSLVFDMGALTNSHFLAIPYNSDAKAASKVVINFLLSPEAQARKADTDIWGDPAVLAMARLTPEEQALFKTAPALCKSVAEPHPSWMTALEKEWNKRYGQ
ncbi:ABC transporter substrate-binding protein [Desulfoluna butyratoxydans]|uniref:Bacterial extracellular solute-binding protein n=1 Tax=Desulfoluna butyratoxydans TaxID=231438 RepID=A0A4U8YJI5_9BACT|nr:ABC transporter substrate-binding protein [Desulfoluna butyratoxydans]VFQ43209.1 bacterial extracellular solute-binding protein [Desulfoluna butyratoxydans]